MTNRLALALGIIVVAALVLDQVVWGGAGTLALLRRGFDLLHWLAFWR